MTVTAVSAPLRAHDLGVRFKRGWALRHCTFELREGRVTALVGPNGAGKSTLMAVTASQRPATEGHVSIHGTPVTTTGINPEVGYLAQDKPLYRRQTVDGMLTLTGHLNPGWDRQLASRLVADADLPPTARVSTLSGGQRTRLALALVLARRPSVLILDEPLADLDPLARFELQQMLLTHVADTGTTVLLSSHITSEIHDSCDDLIILRDGAITLDAAVDDTLDNHRILTGPGAAGTGSGDPDTSEPLAWLPASGVVEIRRHLRQTVVLYRSTPPPLPPGWTDSPATLDEVVMAHLRTRPDTPATSTAAAAKGTTR